MSNNQIHRASDAQRGPNSTQVSSESDAQALLQQQVGATWVGARVDDRGDLSVHFRGATETVLWPYTAWRISAGPCRIASDFDDDLSGSALGTSVGATLRSVAVDSVARSLTLTFDRDVMLETFTTQTVDALWEWHIGDVSVWATAAGLWTGPHTAAR